MTFLDNGIPTLQQFSKYLNIPHEKFNIMENRYLVH